MTAKERIDAAIAAREKATPGPWDAYHVNDKGLWCVAKNESGVTVDPSVSNATLIAAAPDLVDEVVRLRKWQSEAVGILKNENLYLFKGSLSEKEYQINLDTMDRLIAEAQEDYVDGHKQCYVDASPCTRSSDYMDEPREERRCLQK